MLKVCLLEASYLELYLKTTFAETTFAQIQTVVIVSYLTLDYISTAWNNSTSKCLKNIEMYGCFSKPTMWYRFTKLGKQVGRKRHSRHTVKHNDDDGQTIFKSISEHQWTRSSALSDDFSFFLSAQFLQQMKSQMKCTNMPSND